MQMFSSIVSIFLYCSCDALVSFSASKSSQLQISKLKSEASSLSAQASLEKRVDTHHRHPAIAKRWSETLLTWTTVFFFLHVCVKPNVPPPVLTMKFQAQRFLQSTENILRTDRCFANLWGVVAWTWQKMMNLNRIILNFNLNIRSIHKLWKFDNSYYHLLSINRGSSNIRSKEITWTTKIIPPHSASLFENRYQSIELKQFEKTK